MRRLTHTPRAGVHTQDQTEDEDTLKRLRSPPLCYAVLLAASLPEGPGEGRWGGQAGESTLSHR